MISKIIGRELRCEGNTIESILRVRAQYNFFTQDE